MSTVSGRPVPPIWQIRWPDLNQDGRVRTKPFLEACDGIVHFFDQFGAMFGPVKRDIQGNVNSLYNKYLTNPALFKTLNDMVETELATKEGSAIESLLWLKRGLHFTCLLLLSMVEDFDKGLDNPSLAANFYYAYEISLKPHHNWVVQKFFTACVTSRFCPKRMDVLKSMAKDEESKDDAVIEVMREFMNGLRKNLQAILDLYVAKGLDPCKMIR